MMFLFACTPPSTVPPDDRPFVRDDAETFHGRAFPQNGRDLSGYPNPTDNSFVARALGAMPAGFGTTSAITFTLSEPVDIAWPDVHASVLPDSPVQLIDLDTLQPHPIDVHFAEDGGPYGDANLVTLLPLQGMPLRAGVDYAAVIRSPLLRSVEGAPVGVGEVGEVAGFTVFTTYDPTQGLRQALEVARTQPPTPQAFELLEEHTDFCVFRSTVEMPMLQEGIAPYPEGGAWGSPPTVQHTETARVFVTLPRTAGPWPVAVMVRTGGGGDRPLIDRGFRAENGGEPVHAGTGPALHFAAAGVAGVMVDGPLGGLRNPTGGDEQFLIFNIANPPNMRDNVRQSALELALLPELIDGFDIDASACTAGSLDTSRMALFGHSMGATIAPLTVAVQPRYSLLLLSGAGGSWIENVMHKQLPLQVRPLADLIVGYGAGRELHRFDPALSLLQWMGESADPPVYAEAYDGHVFMMQGMVDRYILPPIANSTSLAYGLDRVGPALDESVQEVAALRPLSQLQDFVGSGTSSRPVTQDPLRVVVQYPEGPIEDGHEVVFQTDSPQQDYGDVLRSWAEGAPVLP